MQKECRDLEELHPYVAQLARQLVQACKAQGIEIKVGETYRTVERQEYLYEQGRSRTGKIVTYARGRDKSSYHQWRLAFDVFINEKGNEYNIALLTKAGKIGEKLGLEWGGSWTGFRDMPHFQYTQGLSIEDLKEGKCLIKEEEARDMGKVCIALNGKLKEVQAVKIGGNYYVRMQDLRDEYIVVDYDSKNKWPILKVIQKS